MEATYNNSEGEGIALTVFIHNLNTGIKEWYKQLLLQAFTSI